MTKPYVLEQEDIVNIFLYNITPTIMLQTVRFRFQSPRSDPLKQIALHAKENCGESFLLLNISGNRVTPKRISS